MSEKELKAYTMRHCDTIVIRSYDQYGSSTDTRRIATAEESKLLYSVIYGALLAMRDGRGDKHMAADTAEYIIDLMIPTINGYDSVFCPLMAFPEGAK